MKEVKPVCSYQHLKTYGYLVTFHRSTGQLPIGDAWL
jgi:hypothetical protein